MLSWISALKLFPCFLIKPLSFLCDCYFVKHLSIFYSYLSSHSLLRTTEHVYTVWTSHKVAQLKVKSTWLKQRSQTSQRAVKGSVSQRKGKRWAERIPLLTNTRTLGLCQPKVKVKFFLIQSFHSLEAALVFRVATPTANISHIFNGAPSLALFEIIFPSEPYRRISVDTVKV